MNAKFWLGTISLALSAGLPIMGHTGEDSGSYKHVLLINIDGMHAVDFQNCRRNGSCLRVTRPSGSAAAQWKS